MVRLATALRKIGGTNVNDAQIWLLYGYLIILVHCVHIVIFHMYSITVIGEGKHFGS